MEVAELCFPQLNNSCKTPTHPYTEAILIYVLLSFISVLTVALNLLVIISISHFRQIRLSYVLFFFYLYLKMFPYYCDISEKKAF